MILEDDPCDIIAKSMYGQGLSIDILSQKSGVAQTGIQSILNGEPNSNATHQICRVLGLSTKAILNQEAYRNEVTPPDGLYRFTSPYGYLGVNSYLIRHGETATVFDTGTNAKPLIEFVHKHSLQIDTLYITHRHADHIACLDAFPQTPVIYPESLSDGQILEIGPNKLIALDVSGHAEHAIAFFYNALAFPLCICGDSVFAGSMGKAPDKSRYKQAIETASKSIFTLPDNSIICPGHGPLTTVGFEKSHNPFFSTLP